MKINAFWFRRDLRLDDNHGLWVALTSGKPVIALFIFDDHILDSLPQDDARVEFIHSRIIALQEELARENSYIHVLKGSPEKCWKEAAELYDIDTVFFNHDYEPYALQRDNNIKDQLSKRGISMQGFKDHLIFEGEEVVKDDGKPYTVFTPYKNKWMSKLTGGEGKIPAPLKAFPSAEFTSNFYKNSPTSHPTPSLQSLGFIPSNLEFPSTRVMSSLIADYDKTRDFPAIAGTSKLGIHYRFGTISIRQKALKALQLNQTYLNELIWRDFYAMILFHFPSTIQQAFRQEYDRIVWLNDPTDFEKWKEGKTGYPLVDAGMRELKATGYMHNRVRMVVASFLTKHLLIDWRWGEAYFAEKLLDYDQASNVGGWQWAAGCGTDAAPYFRIFNPQAQAEKFDPEMKYIKKWVPEVDSLTYPKPLVEHKYARERCLATYKKALAR